VTRKTIPHLEPDELAELVIALRSRATLLDAMVHKAKKPDRLDVSRKARIVSDLAIRFAALEAGLG